MTGVYYNDIDPFCCDVLRKNINAGHLPQGFVDDRDIRSIRLSELRKYRQWHLFAGIGGFPHGLRLAGVPDDFPILTGGFPCQPFSAAGQRRGTYDDRYLWPEMFRAVAYLRPNWVLAENVPRIIGVALDQVLLDLESCGYTAWAIVVPACAVDAWHIRERVWILAHAERIGRRTVATHGKTHSECSQVTFRQKQETRMVLSGQNGHRLWCFPDTGAVRVPDGLSRKLDEARLKALGNAVVPQVVAELGRMILAANAMTRRAE